jgi:hypothetical protein
VIGFSQWDEEAIVSLVAMRICNGVCVEANVEVQAVAFLGRRVEGIE